jgi:predicted acyl esterase
MDSPPWSLNYMKHQRDGAFWRAPLRPIETLQVPAFLIGGMQDGYRDSIPSDAALQGARRFCDRVPLQGHPMRRSRVSLGNLAWKDRYRCSSGKLRD